MEPIKFKHHNVIYAENQPEYLPLPAFRNDTETISCWRLTFKERIKILLGRPLWLRQMNFNQPLQPIMPTLECPFVDAGKKGGTK